MFFPIVDPDGNEILPIHDNGEEACWAAGLSAVKEHIKNKTLIWKKRKKQGKACWEPYTREYAPESPTRPYPTIWSDLPTMRQAKAMLRDIFATTDLFSTPKPVELISRILDLSTKKDSIVLDSYAGSGTTAQAVLAQNRKDGGSRKFIMVETEDYADKLTAERVRRVIKGVNDSKDEDLKKGLGGFFTFCELGDEINIENLLKGDKLPSYDELARYAFYTATGQTLDKVKHGADFFVGETANYRVHVIYQPDTHFLRSQESALNMPLAERISKAFSDAKKTALVFATHKFMGQKELSEMRITYCQLPYAIHRVVGD
jgi:adenine-specific DNA-methyltransferase